MRKNYFLSLFLLMTAFWQVEATDGSTSTNTEKTVVAPLAAPTNLTASAVSNNATRLQLNWRDNSSLPDAELEFEIAYSTVPFAYKTIRTGIENFGPTAGAQLTGLQPGMKYYVAVRAVRAFDGVAPACAPTPETPDNAAPTGFSVSCWSNVFEVSTNPLAPTPASNAVVTSVTNQTVSINFMDNSTNETGFEIWRAIGGTTDFKSVRVLPAVAGTGIRSFTDAVDANTFYNYRIIASNTAGFVNFTQTGNFLTLRNPPAAPALLSTLGKGLNSITVSWLNKTPDADIENTYVEQLMNGNWQVISVLPTSVNSLIIPNLSEGTTYQFRVRSRNNGGYGNYSNVLTETTLKRVAPNPSYDLVAKTFSTTQINLQWTLGAEDGVTNNRIAQEIFRSSVSNLEGFVRINTIENMPFTYSDKTCLPKTTYWYKVLSTNQQGVSTFSNVYAATTLGPPYAPSNAAAVLANNALGNAIIKISWKDNSEDEKSFSVERSIDSTFATGVLSGKVDSNKVEATSIPFEEGVTYYYRVKASNQYGDSKYSATTVITPLVTAIPNAPYSLKATATSAEVSLKWGDDSNKESGFEVERSDDGKTYVKIGATGRNEVAYTDKTVKEKTKYYYRVRAMNIKGNSDFSNIAEITTLVKTSASIELAVDNVFQVYPNPTADAVKVTLSENMQNESGVITITDRMNREVSRTVLTTNQSEYRLDMSNFSEGTYTISLRTATQQITKRVYKY
jgi:Secretion system C-terminal sorting domain/Fibronectin type III domain